jgi:type II secretory pathway pseudopilin PulG
VRRLPLASRRSQQGFTYLMVLVCVVAIGIALTGTATVWTTAAKRDREQELLWVGNQFRLAVQRYYEQGPGGVKMYPHSLDELLEDRRWPEPHRHLRRMYADPITGSVDWQTVLTPDGQILGVASPSAAVPLKRAGFDDTYAPFAEAKSYADWRFVYLPEVQH